MRCLKWWTEVQKENIEPIYIWFVPSKFEFCTYFIMYIFAQESMHVIYFKNPQTLGRQIFKHFLCISVMKFHYCFVYFLCIFLFKNADIVCELRYTLESQHRRNGCSRIKSLRGLLWLQQCAQGQPGLQESLSQEVSKDAGVLSEECLLFRKHCDVFLLCG